MHYKKTRLLFIVTILLLMAGTNLQSLQNVFLFHEKSFISNDFLFKLQTPYGWRHANLNKKSVLNLTGPKQDEYIMVIANDLSVLHNKPMEQYSQATAEGIATNLIKPVISAVEKLKVNNFNCVMQQVRANFMDDDGTMVGISYTLAHIKGNNGIYQIHYWTDANLYADRFETQMQIIESFVELPEHAVTSETWNYIKHIGVSQIMKTLPKTFNKMMVATFGKSPVLENLGSTAFPEKQMKSEVALYIAKTANHRILKKVNDFYASALFQKIKVSEQKVFSSRDNQEKEKFIHKFNEDLKNELKSDNSSAKKRKYLIQNIIKTNGHAGQKSDITMGVMELVVYSYLDKNRQEYNSANIRSKLISQRKKVLTRYNKELLNEYIFAYRNLTDTELQEYINFFKSKEGYYSVQLSRNIILFLFNRASRNIYLTM
ncbi:MAG: hypothetical protein ABUK01_06035 [Leptospirales bacterium]